MNSTVEQPSWWGTLRDPSFLVDPYPQLKLWREQGGIHLDPASGIYFVLGHREFSKIARSPKMGRDTRLWRDGWATPAAQARDPLAYELFSEIQPQMINVNPPDHRRMRGVFEEAFKPAAVAALAPMIEAEAARLLDKLGAGGDVEFIEQYAAPLPLRVICNLFDIPADMDDDIGRWSESFIRVLDIMMTPEQRQEALGAIREFKAYVKELIDARRKHPGNNMLDTLVSAFDAGILSEQEALTNLIAMLVAGHETTVSLIGNGMLCLLRNPAEMAKMRADRSLVPGAVEECLRYEPGGNMILRVAIEDFPVEDTVIPAGAMVLGLIGGVNRDPECFADPERFDITRPTNNLQMTFGAGAHTCLGAGFARLEGKIAFNALLDRFDHMELAGEPRWRLDRMNARSLEYLPVRLGRVV
jgi:cytochrome P450